MNFILNIVRIIFNTFQKLTPKTYDIGPLPKVPPTPIPNQVTPPPPKYMWDNWKSSVHSVRLICDEEGLSLSDKNIICACVQQESEFNNNALNFNKNKQGNLLSTDYGICQINDHYHIGHNKDFPTIAYVLDNPDAAVRYMVKMMKVGNLNLWVSFSSGAYKHWLFLFGG